MVEISTEELVLLERVLEEEMDRERDRKVYGEGPLGVAGSGRFCAARDMLARLRDQLRRAA